MKKKHNLISVIIPVYNVEKYINRCVNSIINQTYTNLEIILVDDGSSDESPTLCDALASSDSRVKVIHKKNEGVSKARNTGIENATGKYIAFIDGDDYIDETYFEILEANIKENELICSNYIKEQVLGNKLIDNTNMVYSKDEYIELIMNDKAMGTCWGKLFIKEKINHICFDVNTNYMEDTLFLIQYLHEANIDKIKHFNTNYHYNCLNENSITKNKKIDVIARINTIFYTLDKINILTNNSFTETIESKKVRIIKKNLENLYSKKELDEVVNKIKLPKCNNSKFFLFQILYKGKHTRMLYIFFGMKRNLKMILKKVLKSLK